MIYFEASQEDLNTFCKWSEDWQLIISVYKCAASHINILRERMLTLGAIALQNNDCVRDFRLMREQI